MNETSLISEVFFESSRPFDYTLFRSTLKYFSGTFLLVFRLWTRYVCFWRTWCNLVFNHITRLVFNLKIITWIQTSIYWSDLVFKTLQSKEPNILRSFVERARKKVKTRHWLFHKFVLKIIHFIILPQYYTTTDSSKNKQ